MIERPRWKRKAWKNQEERRCVEDFAEIHFSGNYGI